MANIPPSLAYITQVMLERRMVAICEDYDTDMFRNDPKIVVEHVLYDLRRLRVTLHDFVWAVPEGTKHVTYPSTWWNAFKAAHFPLWAVKRWPIRYKTVSWAAKSTYPTLRLRSESHTAHIVIDESRSEGPL